MEQSTGQNGGKTAYGLLLACCLLAAFKGRGV